MRRTTIVMVRGGIVLVLAAAIIDLPLPVRSQARVRFHLIDRSASVRLGPADALKPEDADRIRAWDQDSRDPVDAVLWASFGRDFAFESRAVDADATDLAGAIETALARNPTEIVLYTDGRADPGRSLLLCRAGGVPIYVFPLGPSQVRDARISRVSTPASAAPGERVTIEVTVEATFSGTIGVRLDEETREVAVDAGAPRRILFTDRPPGPFRVRLEVNDDCPQNNQAVGEVPVRSDRRRVLVLSHAFPAIPEFELKVTPRFEDPHGYDAVVLDNVTPTAEEQRRLAAWVRDFGGGLLLLGGRSSYALGKWRQTPLEEVSPLRANPDHTVAVVFAIDRSGSMGQPGRLDVVLRTIRDGWSFFQSDDHVVAMPFPEAEFITNPSDLHRVRAEGGTFVAEAIRQARLHLEQVRAGRKSIFVFTDGETHPAETPEMRRTEANLLKDRGIGLTIVTTNRELEVGTQVKISDWSALEAKLQELLPGAREVERANPGPLDLRDHPLTAGLPKINLAWMNLTSARQDAQVLATVGRAPDVYPAVAFRQGGRGRVGAFAFPYEANLARLFSRAIEHVAGESSGAMTLSIDPPVVRARGSGPPRIEANYQAVPSLQSGTILLEQVRSDVWEGPLPTTGPGTVFVRRGRAHAAFTVPCAMEFERLGVDRKALERIAAETGGRVLRSPNELSALPRPGNPASRGGRTTFLVTGLVLLFLEMALSTFWKP